MILDLIYITFIVVGIFYSGFPAEIEEIISRRIKVGRFHIPKPFGCQLCMTWWTTLAYIIVTHNLSLPNILICLALAISTTAVESLYRLVFDTIETFLVDLNERING